MLFNSYIFIFILLPLALIGYFLLNRFGKYEFAKLFLVLMSLWFYGYFKVYYLTVILGSMTVNYLLSFIISWIENKTQLSSFCRRFFLIIGVILNLSLLFVFKYYDFVIENINALFHSQFSMLNILLPLGISFFTFQQLSFIIDRSLGRAKHYSLINYLTFVTFFPQLVAGPIVLYDEMMPQFEDLSNKRVNPENLKRGIIQFTLGLSKKVLLADVLAQIANYGFSNSILLDSISALLCMLSYTLQIYFDFSGYSDMAIGIGYMFNIKLPVNFDSPYRSSSIREFWKKWHITLTRFLTRYVYIPLGGSRKGKLRTQINVFMVFLLSGIWHGANWTFILWGVIQGIFIIWDNLNLVGVRNPSLGLNPKIPLPKWLGGLLTFIITTFSFTIFGSDSLKTAFTVFEKFFSFSYTGNVFRMAKAFDISEFYPINKAVSLLIPQYSDYISLILLLFVLLISIAFLFVPNADRICESGAVKTKGRCILIAVLLSWCIISFSTVSTFIYFNF